MKTRIVGLGLALSLIIVLALLVGCDSAPEPTRPSEQTQVASAAPTPAPPTPSPLPTTPTAVPPTPTPLPPTPTLDASAALRLAGIYTTTITEQDTNVGLEGDWEIELTPEGILYLTWNGQRFDPSPFAITQDQIEFGVGPGCGSPWSYRWTMESGVLTFAPVGEDPCSNRQLVLTTHPLLRQSSP
jgi:hypothetical protein